MNLQQATRFFPKNAATRSVSEDSSLADEKILHRCNELLFRENGNRRRCTETFHRKPSIIFFSKKKKKTDSEKFFCEKAKFFSVLSENSRNVYSRLKRNRLREKRTKLTVTNISFHFVSLTHSLTLSRLTRTLPPSRL